MKSEVYILKIEKIGKIGWGQDGAIFGSELFRLDHQGNCSVFDLEELQKCDTAQINSIATFELDKTDIIVPHSNSVCFGCDFYQKDDDYPLLYTNVYNNYASEDDRLLGVCCVYRIQRNGNSFKSELVQMIRISFCEDATLWKACEDAHGVRPYGNFVIDIENHALYAFVMKNEDKGSAYFKFDLPDVGSGDLNERFNVKQVVLGKDDIKEYFIGDYHHYMQGAIMHKGKIYSTEGFENSQKNRPAIRIMDVSSKAEAYFDLLEMGITNEPEFIDFYNGDCLYSDAPGNLYRIEW